MDIPQLCIGLAQIVIMVWALRVSIKSQPAASKIDGETVSAATKPFTWPLVAMTVLAAVGWIPYFLRFNEPIRVMAVTAWGTLDDGCYSVIDGAKLQTYRDKYNLFLACGISNPTVDQNQDTAISISTPFGIEKSPIAIKTQYNQALLDQLKAHAPQPFSVWHDILLFPKNGDIGRIKKLADLREFGGKIVSNCEPIE